MEQRKAFIENFIKRVQKADGNLPLLTLDEFFNGNTEEDSIAPNQWGYGRPTLAELWECFRQLEQRPDVAWVRVALHDDTSIEDDEVFIAGDSIPVCTNATIEDIEKAVDVEHMCSDGAIDWEIPDADIPPVPDTYRVLAIVWD